MIPGGTVPTAVSTMALARLNMITKQLQGGSDLMPGVKVHTRQRVQLWLAKGQHQYLVGPASGDARCATTWGRTTISAAEAAGQTTLSVTAITDTTTFPGTTVTMTGSDIIGIEQDDGTIFWSTISSTGAGPTVVVGAGITTSSASGKYVWWFTSRAQRIPFVEAAVLRNENYKDTSLGIFENAADYENSVSDKYADGSPTAILIEPLRTQTRITLDAQPTKVAQTIILTGLYPAEDYDATTNDIAFPQEALRFLSWELAFALAPATGRAWTPLMEMQRKEARQLYAGLNPEMSTEYFRPNA